MKWQGKDRSKFESTIQALKRTHQAEIADLQKQLQDATRTSSKANDGDPQSEDDREMTNVLTDQVRQKANSKEKKSQNEKNTSSSKRNIESVRDVNDDSLNKGESTDDPENTPEDYAYEESEYMDVAPVDITPRDNDDDDGDSLEMTATKQVRRHSRMLQSIPDTCFLLFCYFFIIPKQFCPTNSQTRKNSF